MKPKQNVIDFRAITHAQIQKLIAIINEKDSTKRATKYYYCSNRYYVVDRDVNDIKIFDILIYRYYREAYDISNIVLSLIYH